MLNYQFLALFLFTDNVSGLYIGVEMWRSRGRLALQEVSEDAVEVSRLSLQTQVWET